MCRALLSHILVGMIAVALAVLPLGPTAMPTHAMAAVPGAAAQPGVQAQDAPCPGCRTACPPAALPACVAQCAAPVAIGHGAAMLLATVAPAHVEPVRAGRPGVAPAPIPPPPKLAL